MPRVGRCQRRPCQGNKAERAQERVQKRVLEHGRERRHGSVDESCKRCDGPPRVSKAAQMGRERQLCLLHISLTGLQGLHSCAGLCFCSALGHSRMELGRLLSTAFLLSGLRGHAAASEAGSSALQTITRTIPDTQLLLG